jgi:hypothetical protein
MCFDPETLQSALQTTELLQANLKHAGLQSA